jgi:hypothetical protein
VHDLPNAVFRAHDQDLLVVAAIVVAAIALTTSHSLVRACPCACAPRAYWCAENFGHGAREARACVPVRVRAACVLVCRKFWARGP